MLLASSGQEWKFHNTINIYWSIMVFFTLLLTSSCQEWQFHIPTSSLLNGNFTLLLTSSGQEWQFHNATGI